MNEVSVQNYELMAVFLSDIGEDNINKELDELEKFISSNQGEVVNKDAWGNRDLSYRIKKQDRGFYYVINFTMNPEKVGEMQRGLNINPSVIRALIVRTPEKYIFRTFAEYQEEEEKAKAAKDEIKRQQEAKKAESGPRPRTPKFEKPERTARPEVKHEKAETKVETAPAPKAEVQEEDSPKKAPAKAKKVEKAEKAPSPKLKLEDVDAKLKSIIDDPDITL